MTQGCGSQRGDSPLRRTDRAVLGYLGRMARCNDGSTCTAGIRKIADACEISERQVQTSTGRLIRAGMIERVGYDFGNPDRSKRGTVYRVLRRGDETEGSPLRHELGEVIELLLNSLEILGERQEQLAGAQERVATETAEICKVIRVLSADITKLVQVTKGGD